MSRRNAEIDALKCKIVDGPALDKLVTDHADLLATAKALAKDVKTEGLTDAEIRKATVAAKIRGRAWLG